MAAVAMLPLLLLAHVLGLESPGDSASVLDGSVALLLGLNALFGTVVSELLWAHSVRLLGPVVPAVGLGLTIPASMLAQVALGDAVFSVWFVLGAVLTLSGFVLIVLQVPTQTENYNRLAQEDTDETDDLSPMSNDAFETAETVNFADGAVPEVYASCI
eukprot:TRINITY_DN10997_c0_g1_i3.p1 TRINITY_DN10997_c0_g1~~TRINITY_DN10997_c0_g1_i3.p1  ORF type:complete len:159 (-),score=30.20 TRINITY_DN10997_c0_g1_i3:158-634(-)